MTVHRTLAKGSRSAILACMVLFAIGCENNQRTPLEPSVRNGISANRVAALNASKVAICHRTPGLNPFVLISVAPTAVKAHLAHGDGLIGDPVPSQPAMVFDASCVPTLARHEIAVTGSWNRTYFALGGLFTVASTGPVDATVTVTGFADPMRVVLLGYNPQGGASTCSTVWLPTPLPSGPAMSPPTVTAHWDAVPPGTYCLNAVTATPVPPWPPSYSWTGTVTYP